MLHKYATVEALKGIISNRAIRFSRFDTLDDQSEEKAFKTLNLAQFLFASSWTVESNETIPMWDRYGDRGTGVRISLPKNMFRWRPIQIPNSMHPIGNHSFESPLTFDQIFGENHFVNTMFLNREHFERPVIYEEDIERIKNEAINIKSHTDGTTEIKIHEPAKIASVKKPIWKFQKEFRFVLMIMPAPKIERNESFFPTLAAIFPNYVLNKIARGIGPPMEYFDVSIEEFVLEKLVVRIGPVASDRVCSDVRLMVKEYAPKAEILLSDLKGELR